MTLKDNRTTYYVYTNTSSPYFDGDYYNDIKFRCKTYYEYDSVHLRYNLQFVCEAYWYQDIHDGLEAYVGCEVKVNGVSLGTVENQRIVTSNSAPPQTFSMTTFSDSIPVASDGSCSFTLYFKGTSNGPQAPSGTRSFTVTLTLPTVPLYATINSFGLSSPSLRSFVASWSTDVSCDQVQYSLSGGAWTTASGSGTSGSFTISGLYPETSYSLKIRVKRTDSQLYTESSLAYISTYQIGKLTGASNWNDEQNPTISFSNVNNQDLRFKIEAGGSNIAIRDVGVIASGNYTFVLTEAERNSLRSLITTNVNALTTRFTVVTQVSGVDSYWNYADKTMSLINYAPTFTDYTYEDTEANAIEMTGNNQNIINGISNIKTTITTENKMVANKMATARTYRTNIGTKSNSVAYSGVSTVEMNINDVDTGVIYVTAIDSRGNTTQVAKTTTIYAHSTPIISNMTFERQNGIDETVDIIGNGTYSNVNYGNHTNTIPKIEYSTDNVNWIDITSKFDIADGTFANKSTGNTLTGFTLGTEYNLYFRVSDGYSTYILSTGTYTNKLASGKPLLDLNKTKNGVAVGGINSTEDTFDCFLNANFKTEIKKIVSDIAYDVLSKADIVNDLTTGGTDVPLSAEQGKDLQTSKQTREDSGWILPTLNSGWSNDYGNAPVRYRKINGIVYLEAFVSATSAAGSVIFTLPTGYRPTTQYKRFPVYISTKSVVWCDIQNGNVQWLDKGSSSCYWFCISISFPAD